MHTQYSSSVDTEVDEFDKLISGTAVARVVGLRLSVITKSFNMSEARVNSWIQEVFLNSEGDRRLFA